MIGKSHLRVAEQALGFVDPDLGAILTANLPWFLTGVEVPDQHLLWERDPSQPAEKGIQPKRLVHRFYLDREGDGRRGELLAMIDTYTEGMISFVREPATSREELEGEIPHWALYLGILVHFLGDLCTPVHIGIGRHERLRKRLGNRYHQKIESALWRHHRTAVVEELLPLPAGDLSIGRLEEIARETYQDYLRMPAVCRTGDVHSEEFADLSRRVFRRAVSVTAHWLNRMVALGGLRAPLKLARDAST